MKVQAALNSRGRVLVYNFSRKWHWEGENVELWEQLMKEFETGKIKQPKFYCNAYLVGTVISLEGRARDQEW